MRGRERIEEGGGGTPHYEKEEARENKRGTLK